MELYISLVNNMGSIMHMLFLYKVMLVLICTHMKDIRIGGTHFHSNLNKVVYI
jgi:hypothetical protein